MKYMNGLVGTLLFSALFFPCMAQTKTGLTADEFETAITAITATNDIQILDVRTAKEFFSGHIKNALLADWNDKTEFNRRLAFMDKNKPVYVYCLGGGRSSAAAKEMRKMGYSSVYELSGGTLAWKAAHKALEGKADEKQMSISELNATIMGSQIVLVDFGATWCPPCKKMEPILKSLVEHNKEKFTLLKVDGGRDQDIVNAFKVTTLPVFIVFKEGKEVWRKDGICSEKELTEQIN